MVNLKNALVTAIGSFSADIVIKNLKRIGYNVIGCDIYQKEWVVDAYQVNKFYQAPLSNREQEYIQFIQKICIEEQINMILPLTDVEIDVFNKNREWFENNNITICISSKETLDICRNKQKIELFIKDNGSVVTPIHTQKVSDMKEVPSVYPVVCKPYDGRSSQGLLYINSEEEWNYFRENITKVDGGGNMLFSLILMEKL